MTRKSAVAIAGGVASALLAGVVALSINMGIMGASGDPAGPGKLGPSPIVKTVVQTVHQKAKGGESAGGVKTVVIPRPASAGSTVTAGSGWTDDHEGDDQGAHEFGENDDD
jgi:hypothetical protein